MSVRKRYRFADWTTLQDATASPEYAARCVTGDDSDCGATSGWSNARGSVQSWMETHVQQTGHLRFQRLFADYAVVGPPPGSIVAGYIAGDAHAREMPEHACASLEPARTHLL
ncbi:MULTISPECIES: DUF7848 domain-containing protein [Streptomyces]|uniref:DUF7848 domain-containing protein n=1 Tax=Streptomyces TaxID=1883 RepID=UPI00345C10BA